MGKSVSVGGAVSVSVTELQQAWRAVQRGDFRRAPSARHSEPAPTAAGSTHREAVRSQTWVAPGRLIAVVGAHGGAGATVFAVALATAVGGPAHVIECTSASRSGLVEASAAELGSTVGGHWVRGTRGEVVLDRLAETTGPVLPIPAVLDAEGHATVLDPGTPQAARDQGWLWGAVHRADLVVVVAAGTIPGLRRAETVLGALDRHDAVVALVGARRRDRRLGLAGGPLVRALGDVGRVVPVPTDRALAWAGLTGRALPVGVLAAAHAVLYAADPHTAEESS